MHARWIILSLAAVAAAPLAFAHDPAGTPKNYCEPLSEWSVHDYGAPATGVLLQGYEDGNIGGNCDGGGLEVAVGNLVNTNPGNPCPGDWWLSLDLDPVPPPMNGVCLDLPVADYDGHAEYARGGAWLLVDTGSGVASPDPNLGAGTLYCYGDEGHHVAYGPFAVEDVVLGAGATFTVASDTEDLTGVGEGCGDFESDNGSDCVGSCTVTFPAGLDGSYQVYVQGTQGHVLDGGGGGGGGPVAVGPDPTLGSGGTMQFDGSGGQPRVSSAPGWACDGPFDVGGEWEIQCSPTFPGAALSPVACTNPYAVAGGTPVSSGWASVGVFCRGGVSSGCSTAWTGVGACLAPPPAVLLGVFPLHCRAQVMGSALGGTLFASCGNLG